ncbi:MAG: terminase small subunit [Eubacterium sp.]
MAKMHKLTPKQEAFVAFYIECGNAAEAARRAGYSKKTARAIGEKNLKNRKIKTAIKEQLEEMASKRLATAEEVMEYLTAVMRGEVKDQFGLDAPLSERTKAAVELAKRIIDKVDNDRSKDGQILAIIEAVQAIE